MSTKAGYGKPPLHSRFKPGCSGNPKGRPKGATSFSAKLERELNGTIAVVENGTRRRLKKIDAVIKQVVTKALKGDHKAIAMILANRAVAIASDGSDADHDLDRQLIQQFFNKARDDASST